MNPSLNRAIERLVDALNYANKTMHEQLVKEGVANAPTNYFSLAEKKEFLPEGSAVAVRLGNGI